MKGGAISRPRSASQLKPGGATDGQTRSISDTGGAPECPATTVWCCVMQFRNCANNCTVQFRALPRAS
eukprot:14455266-Alexandrium_andersonii.AAC.1